MDLLSLVRDNLDEVLVQIIKFTRFHHKIIRKNIRNIHRSDFAPRRLNTIEFVNLISEALAEHVRTGKLVFRDGATIRFGPGGDFQADAIIDNKAKKLFETDIGQYLREQKLQLVENSVNNRVATGLLRQKQQRQETPT